MALTKEQYEKIINGSAFLGMKRTDETKGEYDSAFRKFADQLYEYVDRFVYTNGVMNDFGVEFVQTAQMCIRKYDSTYGEFLHYFLTCISAIINRTRKKRRVEEIRRGTKLGKKTDTICRMIFKYSDTKGLDINDPAVHEHIAQIFGIPVNVIRDAIIANYAAVPVDAAAYNEEGEEIDLSELIADTHISVEDSVIGDRMFTERLVALERIYSACRKDTKRVIGAKLTALLFEEFGADKERLRQISECMFFDDKVYAYFDKNKQAPKDKQLAEMLGLSTASFSRTFANFKNKLTEVKNG